MTLTPKQQEALQSPVASLQLCLRTINALERSGVRTVHDLLHKTAAQLLEEVPNFGPKGLDEVYRALAVLGFKRKKARK